MDNLLLGLVSLAAGSLLGGVLRVFFDRYAAFQESRGVATSIAAEVSALLKLIEARGYHRTIDALVTRVSEPGHVVVADDILSSRTTQDYFTVFRSVTSKIGLLQTLGARVIFFYSLARAVVEDLGELRDRRSELLQGRAAPSATEVAQWHRDFGALLTTTLADGDALLQSLQAFIRRPWLRVFG